jgi:hypothetical protein
MLSSGNKLSAGENLEAICPLPCRLDRSPVAAEWVEPADALTAGLAWLADPRAGDDGLGRCAPATQKTRTTAKAAAKRRNFEIILSLGPVPSDAPGIAAVAEICARPGKWVPFICALDTGEAFGQ